MDSITVTATATDSDEATVVITPEDADDQTADVHEVNLVEGDNVILIVVTAEDGTTETYKVTVNRPPLSRDSTLSALSLKDGEDEELSETFSSGRTSYTASVDADVNSLVLTATANEANAGVCG